MAVVPVGTVTSTLSIENGAEIPEPFGSPGEDLT